MLLGESRAWDEHHRGIEKNEYIPTDSESIRGARSENRPRGKIGVSGLTKPIIQCPLKPPINICLVRLLPGPLSASSQANGQRKPDYKPHLKIACRDALKAASYIFVLSIIPPR